MKLLAWLVKLGFFLLVLWFALKNTTPVPVRFSADFALDRVPLIVVMLICVAVGALLGALALALPIYKMHPAACGGSSCSPTDLAVFDLSNLDLALRRRQLITVRALSVPTPR